MTTEAERLARVEGILEQVDRRLTRLEADLLALRQEMATGRQEIRQEMATGRQEAREEIGSLRQEIAALRQETREEIGSLRQEMRTQFYWLVGIMVTVLAGLVGLAASILVTGR
ncbi:MAG: hypothetical protein NZ951_02575 [Dehalococcoidia bacterium]|nr:hypothetical protein [Dehalococcoidia bacterium]MDW8119845.1 hypothetical protein [Chloroflexota bacterium]